MESFDPCFYIHLMFLWNKDGFQRLILRIILFEEMNEVIQYEPADAFNAELVGVFASIGIKKGKKFAPNEKMKKIFDGKIEAKLGTEKNPAVVNVKTKKRMKEVASIFEEKGWVFTIGLEPDKPEDITDLELLLNPPKTVTAEKKVGRNDPCPCGSGKKYKKCCGE